MTMRNRLEKLESAKRDGTVIIWRNVDETDNQAIGRWRAEHAGQKLENAGQVYVVGWSNQPLA